MLMTPTLASRSSVMKSFIKRNTPLRVDPKVREPVPWLCFAGAGTVWLKTLSLLEVVWAS